MAKRKETLDDVFAGRTLGELMVDGAEELASDLAGGVDIQAKYRIHNVKKPNSLPPFSAEALAARNVFPASQRAFAAPDCQPTQSIWEQGITKPNMAIRRIFHFIQRDPAYWRRYLIKRWLSGRRQAGHALSPEDSKAKSNRHRTKKDGRKKNDSTATHARQIEYSPPPT